MYTENARKDALLFAKAVLSNQVARFAPKLYVRLTNQTGRGDQEGSADEIADYFLQCFEDYREQLGFCRSEFRSFLAGKTVMEYGPGDILGMALLAYAHGAKTVHCIDRFPLHRVSEKSVLVYQSLLNRVEGEQRRRAMNAFRVPGRPESGFAVNSVLYEVTRDGLSGKANAYELILSRAVLEHVNDLDATFADMKNALKPDGKSIHKVDLSSHGLDRYRPLDFLTWPRVAYQLMFSHKGNPNRWRVDKYVAAARNVGLCIKRLSPTGRLDPEDTKRIQPELAKDFKTSGADELRWLGFWMVLEHASARSSVSMRQLQP